MKDNAQGHSGVRRGGQLVRRMVDIGMTVVIVILLSFQITGQQVHEWMGITMTVLVILHTILNRRWYGNVFRGKYQPLRVLQAAVNIYLLFCFVLTAVSGMLMSQYAVPFFRLESQVGRARALHLGFSHWSFVLISVHLGLHWGMMLQIISARHKKRKTRRKSGYAAARTDKGLSVNAVNVRQYSGKVENTDTSLYADHESASSAVSPESSSGRKTSPTSPGGVEASNSFSLISNILVLAAGYGMFLSIREQIYSYMLFQVSFAFLDYDKPATQVFIENILMMLSWSLPAYELTRILKKPLSKNWQFTGRGKGAALMMILAEFVIAIAFLRIFPER